jgi:hypothetical protein
LKKGQVEGEEGMPTTASVFVVGIKIVEILIQEAGEA